MINNHKKLIAVLTVAILVLTVGAVSVFAFTPYAPYFSMSINFDSSLPIGNASVFDIQDSYIDPVDNEIYTLIFFRPERFYVSQLSHDLILTVDELWIIDPSDGTAYQTMVTGEGYAQINRDWLLTNGAGILCYQVDNIGINIYDTTDQQFSRIPGIGTVYLKVN
jgi:hypothetical protein